MKHLKNFFLAFILTLIPFYGVADTIGGGAIHGTGPLNYLPLTGGTLTGQIVITPTISERSLIINGFSGAWGASIAGGSVSGSSYGLLINGGTTSADWALLVRDTTNTTTFLSIAGDGTLTSEKACASGYTRVGLNYCARNLGSGTTSLTSTCTAYATPTNAKALVLQLTALAKAANSVALRSSLTVASNSSGCVSTESVSATAYEFTALGVAYILAQNTVTMLYPLSSTGANFYAKFTSDSGANSTGNYYIEGYYD